jgi:hypothetical protein
MAIKDHFPMTSAALRRLRRNLIVALLAKLSAADESIVIAFGEVIEVHTLERLRRPGLDKREYVTIRGVR